MTAVIFPADAGGCGHYRLIYPAEALGVPNAERSADRVPRIVVGWNEPVAGIEQEWHIPIELASTPDFETLVFQRPLHRKWSFLYPLLREKGHRVVVDIDDHFDRIDPRNVAWYDVEPGWVRREEFDALKERLGEVQVHKLVAGGSPQRRASAC
jgi:hypothetical protein